MVVSLTSLEGLGLNLEVAADIFNQAAGEWVELPSADDSSSPWSPRGNACDLSQRWSPPVMTTRALRAQITTASQAST